MGTTEEIDDDGSADPPQSKPEGEAGNEAPKLDVPSDPPPSDPEPEGKKILQIRSDAMKGIKERSHSAGRREAEEAQRAQLKESGFDNLQDMADELAKLREKKAVDASKEKEKMAKKDEEDAAQTSDELEKLRGERTAAVEAKRKANRARAREEQRRRGLQRRLDAEQAERSLEREALKAGVQDTDYALVLLRRHLKAKRDSGESDYIESFKADDYFAKQLRDSHPHLYKTVDRKANTAGAADAGNGEAGAPPKDGQPPAAGAGAQGGKKDVRDMSQQEYHAELKSRGLAIPNTGF